LVRKKQRKREKRKKQIKRGISGRMWLKPGTTSGWTGPPTVWTEYDDGADQRR